MRDNSDQARSNAFFLLGMAYALLRRVQKGEDWDTMRVDMQMFFDVFDSMVEDIKNPASPPHP